MLLAPARGANLWPSRSPRRARRLTAEAQPGAIRCVGGACTGLQPLVAGVAAPLELARFAHNTEARASTTTPARATILPNAAQQHAAPAGAPDSAIFESSPVFSWRRCPIVC